MGGQGRAASEPEQDEREAECDDHADKVQRKVAHALAAKFTQQGRRRPGKGHSNRNQFTNVLHGTKIILFCSLVSLLQNYSLSLQVDESCYNPLDLVNGLNGNMLNRN